MRNKIEIKTFTLDGLLKFIKSKKVSIPEFQRGYVWKNNQIKALFDSLVKNYPIGVFTIWKTNKKINPRDLFGVNPLKSGNKYFILDGQQRMLSLFYLCNQDRFEGTIKEEFDENYEGSQKNPINFKEFYFNKKPELKQNERGNPDFDYNQFEKMLKGYKFPAIIVSTRNFEDAIKLFERINQAGTRISTEAIFLSDSWSRRSSIRKILREWKKKDKGKISSKLKDIIFIHAFAIILQLEEKNDYDPEAEVDVSLRKLGEIAEKIREKKSRRYNQIFKNVLETVKYAMAYLKSNFKLNSTDELPSQTMLTVLSIFFYYNKNKAPTKSQNKELRKWFWRSALGSRYVGSGYNQNIRKDPTSMRNLARNKIKSLNIPIQNIKKEDLVKISFGTGKSSVGNCIRLMLLSKRPYWLNGTPSLIETESEKTKREGDHFYAHNLLSKNSIPEHKVNSILNLIFLPRGENAGKQDFLPSDWLIEKREEYKPKKKEEENFFRSNLLCFNSISDLRKVELKLKRKSGAIKPKILAKYYENFLNKRFKLFSKELKKLQRSG